MSYRLLRVGLMASALTGLVWFQFGQERSASEVWGLGRDLTDSRPAHSVLFLGNSRTFYHDMPEMVRAIADSARDPEKYQIMVLAEPGASFQTLSKDDRVRRVAAKQWDDVILQGESRGQTSDALQQDFEHYGEVLAGMAHASRGRPWLIVNWTYDPVVYNNPGIDRPAHMVRVRSSHDELSRKANLREISVSQVWEQVRTSYPDIQLTEDGNHPTIAGSYLVALATYSKLSGRQVADVRYSPPGLDPYEAEAMRRMVARSN